MNQHTATLANDTSNESPVILSGAEIRQYARRRVDARNLQTDIFRSEQQGDTSLTTQGLSVGEYQHAPKTDNDLVFQEPRPMRKWVERAMRSMADLNPDIMVHDSTSSEHIEGGTSQTRPNLVTRIQQVSNERNSNDNWLPWKRTRFSGDSDRSASVDGMDDYAEPESYLQNSNTDPQIKTSAKQCQFRRAIPRRSMEVSYGQASPITRESEHNTDCLRSSASDATIHPIVTGGPVPSIPILRKPVPMIDGRQSANQDSLARSDSDLKMSATLTFDDSDKTFHAYDPSGYHFDSSEDDTKTMETGGEIIANEGDGPDGDERVTRGSGIRPQIPISSDIIPSVASKDFDSLAYHSLVSVAAAVGLGTLGYCVRRRMGSSDTGRSL